MTGINLTMRLFLNDIIYKELENSLLNCISTCIDCLSISKENNIIQLKVKKTSVKNILPQNLNGYYKTQIDNAMNTFFSSNYSYIAARSAAQVFNYPNINLNDLYAASNLYYNVVIVSDSIIQIIL